MIGISVSEALLLPAFSGAKIVAGISGIHRIIESINIMEVPDISNYIKPNEMLLTTAYPIKDNQDALTSLVPKLNEKGLAALAIKPKRYLEEIPQIMIQQANELNLPLIYLPNNASFSEIINPILTEILNQQAAILSRNQEISKSLSKIMLQGGGLNQVTQTLANYLKLPISLHDPAFRKMSSCLSPYYFGEKTNRSLTDIVNSKDLLTNYYKDNGDWSNFKAHGGCNAAYRPIVVSGEILAHLFIWEPIDPLSEKALPSLEQAVTMIALEISKLRDIVDVEFQFKSSFIEYLVDGRFGSLDEVISRSQKFGWDIGSGFTVMLVENAEIDSKLLSDPIFASKQKKKLLHTIAGLLETFSPKSGVVESGNRVIILNRVHAHKDPFAIKKRSEQLSMLCNDELLKKKLGSVTIGISRFIENPLYVGEGINQAKRALEFGRRLLTKSQIRVFHYDDLGVYRLLLNTDEKEMATFCQEILGPLLEYDKANKADLVSTLEAVLTYDMNLQKSADALFIHYNTLRYRFQRIQEITKLDLRSADDRLNVQVALKILHMR